MIEGPEPRCRLLPAIAAHVDRLVGRDDSEAIPHRGEAEAFGAWIDAHRRSESGAPVIVVCTGNSRRSILGATMGNIVAAFLGRPEVRFSSGGTAPSAFNPRTIAALEAIGVVITPTGDQAPPGLSNEPNPVYRVRWGAVPGNPETEAIEFSKRYDDASNPRSGFAALMVCDEAADDCPAVPGASLRVPIPFADPKEADGTPVEPVRYAERRDDLARWMLHALTRVR
jgi:arsenate reductase